MIDYYPIQGEILLVTSYYKTPEVGTGSPHYGWDRLYLTLQIEVPVLISYILAVTSAIINQNII